jgi:hypothetical protein
MALFRERVRREALQAGADYSLISTDVPIDVAIRNWRAGGRTQQEELPTRAV